jgi:LysM repeat protein
MEEHPDSPEALDVIEREARRCGDEGDVGLEWEALSFVFLRLRPGERRDLTKTRLDELVDRIIFSPRPGPYSELYRIQPGDNLDKIAARFNCPKDLIARMNRIKDPNLIQEGQRLKVLHGVREILVPVGPGEKMQTIADAHDTTLEELLALNETDDPAVEIGDRVKVRVGAFEIHVSKADFTLNVLWHGKYARQYAVGIGLDDRTPKGEFTVSDRIKDPAWYNEGERIPSGDPRNILGTRWIGFKETDLVSGIGIHGTTQPDTIGTESSAGCIRLRNEDVEELCLLTPRGTTVRIR